MTSVTLVTENKQKKRKGKSIGLAQQIPKEFREDCKTFSIDFEKLQPKVDRIFDKWINKGNTGKTVAKWIRFMMKEAGYNPKTIWTVIKKNHPELIGPQAHKMITKSNHSNVTTIEEPDTIWQIEPEEYKIEDVEQYDRVFLIRLVKYMHEYVEKSFERNQKTAKECDDLTVENRHLKEQIARLQKQLEKK